MERVYFSINEAGAKTANDMMSFSEYKAGSKTAGYKAQVDKAYELAEKPTARMEVADIRNEKGR